MCNLYMSIVWTSKHLDMVSKMAETMEWRGVLNEGGNLA